MISAPGAPPGSRVNSVPIPNDLIRDASNAACVDLPVPSPPSKVMKRPRIFRSKNSDRAATSAIRLYPFGGRTKQLDHKFRGGVEGALRDRSDFHGLARQHRHLQHLGVA